MSFEFRVVHSPLSQAFEFEDLPVPLLSVHVFIRLRELELIAFEEEDPATMYHLRELLSCFSHVKRVRLEMQDTV